MIDDNIEMKVVAGKKTEQSKTDTERRKPRVRNKVAEALK